VSDIALAVEHVGSTSVPGLAAKPIIDISVVVSARAQIPAVIERLAALGYVHQGDLGVEGREAFDGPAGLPAHHLYVCRDDSTALANHLALRDYLRSHPETARAYGELKRRLAREFPHDIDRYIEGKTDFIVDILRATGIAASRLDTIARANRRARVGQLD
jgi:GrpB-like predicted nucleotidyltransferase (UPF0157 family)